MIGLYADRGGIIMRKRQSGARLLALISYPSHSPARSALSSRKPTHLPAPSPPSGPHVGSCEEQMSLPLPYFTAVAEAKQNSFPWEEWWKRNSTKIYQLLRRIASIILTGGVQEKKRFSMLGLDNTGKTSLLYQMLPPNEVAVTIPNFAFNVERVEHKNMDMTIWDMSDQRKGSRRLWPHFAADTDAVIFVIDSSDQARLEEARDMVLTVLADPYIHDCCTVLLFLNKQDLPWAVRPSWMMEKLELDSVQADPLKRRKWHMQACCATTGAGVHEGLEWLSDALSKQQARPITS